MAAANRIPEELIEDILSTMPAKSLVRFKTVSKKWYSLLSQDYNFAKFHLNYYKTKTKNHQLLFLQISYGASVFLSFDIDNTNASCNKFNSPVEVEGEAVLVGSANGLICLARKGGCFIWNPCTGECKKICLPIPCASYRVSGFGYDSCSDDYKIVADWDKHFRVFSLKSNSWKPYEYSFNRGIKAFHLNGTLHWCLKEKIAAFDSAKEIHIAAFDLAKETFSYIELPDEVTGFFHFLDYRGLLCVFEFRRTSIWVMKIYGDPKSWVKFGTLPVEYTTPLGISTRGEVVYQLASEEGFQYRFAVVKSNTQGRMSPNDKMHIYTNAWPTFRFTGSLISPRCFDALHENSKRRPSKQRKTTAT